VPVAWYGAIAEGMTGKVVPEEPVGGEHAATVTIVDRVVDAASGTFGVRLELPNPTCGCPPASVPRALRSALRRGSARGRSGAPLWGAGATRTPGRTTVPGAGASSVVGRPSSDVRLSDFGGSGDRRINPTGDPSTALQGT